MRGEQGFVDRALDDTNDHDDSFTRVRVLGKMRDILDVFSLAEPELDLRRIREGAGLPHSTAVRLVRNMVSDGLLTQTPGGYRIGMTVVRWAAVAQQGLGLLETATPGLNALRDRTSESAGLFVRHGVVRVCVALAESNRAVGRRLALGHVLPVHAGAPGKTLLAFDPDAADLLPSLELRALTGRTLTDPTALGRELDRIRTAGYAVSRGEWDLEVVGVAAPVFGADGRLVAALGVSGPASRLTDPLLPGVIDDVVGGAANLSAEQGFTIGRR